MQKCGGGFSRTPCSYFVFHSFIHTCEQNTLHIQFIIELFVVVLCVLSFLFPGAPRHGMARLGIIKHWTPIRWQLWYDSLFAVVHEYPILFRCLWWRHGTCQPHTALTYIHTYAVIYHRLLYQCDIWQAWETLNEYIVYGLIWAGFGWKAGVGVNLDAEMEINWNRRDRNVSFSFIYSFFFVEFECFISTRSINWHRCGLLWLIGVFSLCCTAISHPMPYILGSRACEYLFSYQGRPKIPLMRLRFFSSYFDIAVINIIRSYQCGRRHWHNFFLPLLLLADQNTHINSGVSLLSST